MENRKGIRKAAGGSAAIQGTDPNTNERICYVIIAKKGGFGTRGQASPNPHTAHIPEAILQVVYE